LARRPFNVAAPQRDSGCALQGSLSSRWKRAGQGSDTKQTGDTLAAKYVLKRGTTGKFRFHLLSSNGKVIATSEAYESKSAAMKGIESVRKNAADAKLDDQSEVRERRGGQQKRGGRVKRALERDWKQTKSDLPGLKGKNLNQGVGDTLEQATGA
jgi:uncharacterized protein YegP (UPF0339 family)